MQMEDFPACEIGRFNQKVLKDILYQVRTPELQTSPFALSTTERKIEVSPESEQELPPSPARQ